MKAAVLNAYNEDLVISDLDLQDPKQGEVRVKVAASGVCHSDLSVRDGKLVNPVPAVLGHEGAGVVEAVGPGVTSLAPGDHVVISWVGQCGRCYTCLRGQPEICEASFVAMATGGLLDATPRFVREGQPVCHMSGSGTFTEATVVPEMSAVKIDPDFPLDKAALIGCAVLTGVGAALNTAGVTPGSTVAVIGCGGVGLNVVQGAKIAGAGQIIAVDKVPMKLEMARTFGATDVVNADEGNPVEQVMALTGMTPLGLRRGVDYAFEVIGNATTIGQAIEVTRRGGTTVVVGVPGPAEMISIPGFLGLVVAEKTIKGCWYGSSNVFRDVPRIASLYRKGDLKLDELVSRTITLEEVNDALEALRTGEAARSVIVY